MELLIRLSLRNLLRQKRRNLLLGSAMAIGVAILVTAGSFSAGISDIMFNRIMRYVTGHVSVRFNERGGVMREIFRDGERARAALQGVPGVEKAEEGVGYFMRAIGNGKSDNIILVGANMSAELSDKERREIEESFRVVEGSWEGARDSKAENPIIISAEKARYLNVTLGDTVRVRFRDMFGQDQAARLTVAGVMRNDNIFMQPVVFLERERAKALLGYRPWETASFSLTLSDPKRGARAVADAIHARLKPGLASMEASVNGRKTALFGVKSDAASREALAARLKLSPAVLEAALRRDGALLDARTARALGVRQGEEFRASWARKFEPGLGETRLKAAAIFSGEGPGGVLVNDGKFYAAYYRDLPAAGAAPAPGWEALLAPEWTLLPRTYTTDDYKKKYQEIARSRGKGTTADVSTMYETASDILKLEGVLNLITLSAVLVLFFIILLGVVNTLRMTIRERTKEIGTVRAIGMRAEDVRNTFLLETFFLTLFSSAAGVALGFLAMSLISVPEFHPQDNPLGMLLVNGRVYFLTTFWNTAGSVLLIMGIALATAWFPARRAAAMSPAQALRHYD
ncbi:MAG: ABC transporter permease [Elusimicrobiales bacterium]|nr:ABC transporter permease [Elusimicrobiales bacterium]